MDERVIITGADLVTLDAEERVISDGVLALEGDRITFVGTSSDPDAPAAGEDTACIDGRGKVVMPGFSNCHTHSYAALLKGSVDRVPLDVFMVTAILGAGARTPRDVYLAAKISAAEMLMTGTTACLDHFSHRPRHTGEALDAVCSAYADGGVRAAVAPMFSDLPFRETIPLRDRDMDPTIAQALPGTGADPDPYFEMMEAALARWKGHATVSVMLGVDSPQRCSEALLARAGAFCAQHDIGNHTHLLEAKTQWAMAAGRDARGFVDYLADLGLAGPRSSFAHFIWFTEADVARAAQSGVNVIHNPASNLVLGSGIQPLLTLIDAGVRVAFGSDGLNVGHLSMFEKTRLAAYLTRVTEADPARWLSAPSALKMATVNGAAAVGLAGKAGMLAPGQLADFVILDGNSVALSPRGDLPTQIVFYETGAGVRDVFVAGEHVLKDGAPTRFDLADTLAEAREAAERLTRETEDMVAKVETFRPGLTNMVRRIVAQEDGPCRIAKLC